MTLLPVPMDRYKFEVYTCSVLNFDLQVNLSLLKLHLLVKFMFRSVYIGATATDFLMFRGVY